MNVIAPIGHNNPPDPMEVIQAEYDDVFAETPNWLDGTPVENAAQMKCVDALLARIKDAERDAKDRKEEEYRPHKAAGDAVIARWKPLLDDLERQRKGLIACVDGYKRKEAAAKEEARRKAEAEAWEKTRAAREAAERANASDLEAQRAADAAIREAEEAQKRAAVAAKDTVKGLRAHTDYIVIDRTAFARWLWGDTEGRAAFEAWQDEYARRNKLEIPGAVEARTERRTV